MTHRLWKSALTLCLFRPFRSAVCIHISAACHHQYRSMEWVPGVYHFARETRSILHTLVALATGIFCHFIILTTPRSRYTFASALDVDWSSGKSITRRKNEDLSRSMLGKRCYFFCCAPHSPTHTDTHLLPCNCHLYWLPCSRGHGWTF